MQKLTAAVAILTLIIAIAQACKYDEISTPDNVLFKEVNSGNYVYYKGGTLLSPAAPSPHGPFKLKFNTVAAAALDANGNLPAGSRFPDGSVIVKEVYNGNALGLYAVIKKDPVNVNAGSNWVWAELYLNGTPAFSVIRKGDGCIPCHGGSPNRDLTRTFDLH